MRERIAIVAENSWRELCSRKALYILAVAILLGFIFPLYLSSHWLAKNKGPQAIQAAILWACSSLTFIGLCVSALFAATSVETEVTRRTLASVMVRPIARWEYLAGRVTGVMGLYFLFLTVASLGGYIASFLLNVGLPVDFMLGSLQRAVKGMAWILLAFSLGVSTSSAMSLILIAGFSLFGVIFPHVPDELHALIPWIKQALHYLAPASFAKDYWDMMSRSESSFWMTAATALENVMYGIAFFVLSALGFTRNDLHLRGS